MTYWFYTMFQSSSLYVIALLLSLSILGPSLSSILESNIDIEVVQDLEEEKEETKKELEAYEKFLSNMPPFTLEFKEATHVSSQYYIVAISSHILDIHCPPPDFK